MCPANDVRSEGKKKAMNLMSLGGVETGPNRSQDSAETPMSQGRCHLRYEDTSSNGLFEESIETRDDRNSLKTQQCECESSKGKVSLKSGEEEQKLFFRKMQK